MQISFVMFHLFIAEPGQSLLITFFGLFGKGNRRTDMSDQSKIGVKDRFPFRTFQNRRDLFGRILHRKAHDSHTEGSGAQPFVALQHIGIDAVLIQSEERVAFPLIRSRQNKGALHFERGLSSGFDFGIQNIKTFFSRCGKVEFNYRYFICFQCFTDFRNRADAIAVKVADHRMDRYVGTLGCRIFEFKNKVRFLSGIIIPSAFTRGIVCPRPECFGEDLLGTGLRRCRQTPAQHEGQKCYTKFHKTTFRIRAFWHF